MAISIKDAETDRLARELAAVTGESLTDAIRNALRDRLEREKGRSYPSIAAKIRRVQERVARLPVLDSRPADDLVQYDDHGVPV